MNFKRVSSYPGQGVDFFDFDKWDSTQIDFAAIVPTAHAHECSSKAAPMTLEAYEKGKYSRRRTAAFCRDTQLLNLSGFTVFTQNGMIRSFGQSLYCSSWSGIVTVLPLSSKSSRQNQVLDLRHFI